MEAAAVLAECAGMGDGIDRELEEPGEVERYLAEHGHLRSVVVQGVDLSEVEVDWAKADVREAVFVACPMPSPDIAATLQRRKAVVIPDLADKRPYSVYPRRLYSYESLHEDDRDTAIQKWFNRRRRAAAEPERPVEAIAERLHDSAMSDGIGDFLGEEGRDPDHVVGIMGGHGEPRASASYERIVRLAYRLTAAGYLVVTGGGPGIMEAGNLGAYLTRAQDEAEIERALHRLAQAPCPDDPGYAKAAEDVHRRLAGKGRSGGESLAVPTWLYGHEPVSRFASHIAKYFANSIREDGLLRMARAGIVFAPGGPGTVQEVFQDGAINAYSKPRHRAPMIFVGRDHFEASGVYGLAVAMAERAKPPYRHLLTLTDDIDEALEHIESPPAQPRKSRSILRVYVASPLGFAESTSAFSRDVLLPALRKARIEVLDPWEDPGWIGRDYAAARQQPPGEERDAAIDAVNRHLGERNAGMLRDSQAVLAVLDGQEVDGGTAAEVGYAAALGRPVVGLRTDFRLSGENERSQVNLQVRYFASPDHKLCATVDEAVAELREVARKSG